MMIDMIADNHDGLPTVNCANVTAATAAAAAAATSPLSKRKVFGG